MKLGALDDANVPRLNRAARALRNSPSQEALVAPIRHPHA